MKRPKVKHTIAGEHTKYTARCMEGEYHSQEIKNKDYPNTYLGTRSEVVERNKGMRTMNVDNHPDTILSGIQRFVAKYGYNWKDDT